jgi:nucleoside-diphosphate-sugar epimerase
MSNQFTDLNEIPDCWPGAPLRDTIRRQRPFWKGRRALVTGAFGFLGGHLCRALLAAGCEVTALDKCTSLARDSQLNLTGLRGHVQVVEADITDRATMQELVTESRFDVIFHIAAGATVIEKALSSPYDTIMANTMGFVNLAEAARLLPEEQRPVILYSSTDKVYGEAKVLPYTEESDLGGVGVYDSAKLAADIFAGTYHKALGVPTIVLRMCNLFGPYDFNIDYRLIPKALRNIFRDGEAPELYLNALEHFRDYIYVEDAARAFMILAKNQACRGRVYNLPGVHHAATPDVLTTLTETVTKMQDDEMERHPDSPFAHHKWSRSIRVVPSDPKLIVISKQHLDGTRIRDEAGFEPLVGFRDGLKSTIKFYAWLFCRDAGRCRAGGSLDDALPLSNGETSIHAEVVTLPPTESPLFK